MLACMTTSSFCGSRSQTTHRALVLAWWLSQHSARKSLEDAAMCRNRGPCFTMAGHSRPLYGGGCKLYKLYKLSAQPTCPVVSKICGPLAAALQPPANTTKSTNSTDSNGSPDSADAEALQAGPPLQTLQALRTPPPPHTPYPHNPVEIVEIAEFASASNLYVCWACRCCRDCRVRRSLSKL